MGAKRSKNKYDLVISHGETVTREAVTGRVLVRGGTLVAGEVSGHVDIESGTAVVSKVTDTGFVHVKGRRGMAVVGEIAVPGLVYAAPSLWDRGAVVTIGKVGDQPEEIRQIEEELHSGWT